MVVVCYTNGGNYQSSSKYVSALPMTPLIGLPHTPGICTALSHVTCTMGTPWSSKDFMWPPSYRPTFRTVGKPYQLFWWNSSAGLPNQKYPSGSPLLPRGGPAKGRQGVHCMHKKTRNTFIFPPEALSYLILHGDYHDTVPDNGFHYHVKYGGGEWIPLGDPLVVFKWGDTITTRSGHQKEVLPILM